MCTTADERTTDLVFKITNLLAQRQLYYLDYDLTRFKLLRNRSTKPEKNLQPQRLLLL